MSNDGEGEGRGFKVVDRRRFTFEGEERSGPDIPEERPAQKTEVPPRPGAATAPLPDLGPAAAEAPAEPAPAQEAEEEEGIPFAVFVQSLAQQAMMQLGLIPWPHTNQRELHLEQARDTIDVLSMLKAKTKGNLSVQESQLLETALYELRMTWVEINQQLAAQARSGGMPKPG